APGYSKKQGISLETAARELRYDFLNRVAKGVIATAHTASDNIETILFNMTRGASLNGICGIPPKRDNIIRPLIFCDRESVEKYCEDNGLSFVTDSTNFVDDCSRNIIRHKIVPVLKKINSACIKNVTNLSSNLIEDNSYLQSIADIELQNRLNDQELSVKDFGKLPASIAKRVLIIYFRRYFGVLPDTYHIERIYDVCLGKIIKTSVIRDMFAVRNGDFIRFENAISPDRNFSVENKILSIEDYKKFKNVHELLSINAVDRDKIVDEVRQIRKNNSDLIKLANSSVTKTVKKLLTEKKIPLEYRNNLPVFADNAGIIWIYGVGVADRVKVDKTTKTVLYFDSEIL
ncbi:MAG: tRNA lysidine(34) synthetase TilS, partial [Clostridia bacterium]|nr:tRNA lysidine(34) synthetase TilS [Clostridia bacterium]